jgi:hypothetical protein
MSWQSGPQVPEDEQGHATAYGYVITGHDGQGFRARLILGLTESEALYGCQELLFSDQLADLLVLCHAQQIQRSMVGTAAARVPGGSPAAAPRQM